MILEQLALRDFCLFRGQQAFDLSPTPLPKGAGTRRIVLFGNAGGGEQAPLPPAGRLIGGNLAIGVWSCACQDADGIIFPLFRSGSGWSKYSNPAYDAVVDAARSTLDPEKRLADYRKAYEILREDVPGLGLYQAFATYGARKELRWQPTPNESFFVMDMSWQ